MAVNLKSRKRLRVILVLVFIIVVGFGIVFVRQRSQPANPIVLRFLGYTNIDGRQLYAFEITNQLSRDISWSFHSEGTNLLGRSMDFTIGVRTEHGSSYGGSALDSHASLRFAASGELRSGERLWFQFTPQPNAMDRWRWRLGSFLLRMGWQSGERLVVPSFSTRRVNGPVIP